MGVGESEKVPCAIPISTNCFICVYHTKMRYLLIPLTLLVLIFATPTVAEEIIMICHRHGKTVKLKYVNPIVGFRKVYIRREGGRWENWDDSDSTHHRPPKLTINDRGAILETVMRENSDKDYPKYGLRKDDPFLIYERLVLDFEFLNRTVTWWKTHMDGFPLKIEEEGYDADKPAIDHWQCEKHTPDNPKKY